ncbi:hypothetical protein TrVE_jg11378 [Triparma verrucosa]|uniref:SSD domain-containing protein n=1 Tax=Triparma verrucosa TaxID=1606542 RepID=A0A9W7EMW0_9STRA|nr:hypothetical protein TrVE_jg11378 [Triparma verrucosa]
MESGYVNTEDPTLGFISKGTTIIGREYAKDKVDRGYFYWPGRKRLFYSSPKKASRGDPGTWRRRKLSSQQQIRSTSRMLLEQEEEEEYHMDGHENAPTSTTTTTPKYTPHPTPRDFSTATSIMYTIGEDSHYINLREVTAFDSNGNQIEPLSATLSSIYSDDRDNLGPQNCIDNNPDTICHSEDQPETWLRIDYSEGALADLDEIVIQNRIDCCSDRISGAYVTVAEGSPDNLNEMLLSSLFTSPALIYPNPILDANEVYSVSPKADAEVDPNDPYLDLIVLREKSDITCPESSYEGDEHITLLFVHVNEDGPVNTPRNFHDHSKSVVTAESLRQMCEIETIVRHFRSSVNRGYETCDEGGCYRACAREGMYSGGEECCATRKITVPSFLEYNYYMAGDDDNQYLNHTWDPYTQTEANFRVPNSCDIFTDEHARVLNDILRDCAPYFEANKENLLNRCAVAGNIIKKGHQPDSEEYFWAWATSIECIAEIPSKCLRGNGAGIMDSYLSLLPFETAKQLKRGSYPITVARSMVAVTLTRGEHSHWKWELQKELEKKFYYMNGKKALNGKSTGTALLGFNLGTKKEIFTWYIMKDINYAVIACFVVLVLMWWYTNSLRVTLLAFGEILSSLGLGFFLYNTVLRLPHFPFMNATTIFLAIGIGADDVFVYVDSWRHSLKHCKSADGQPPTNKERLEYSLKHAGMSTFVTSFTTSAAFAANIMSKIVSVKCFGVFAALVILCDYVLMITFLPAVVLNYDSEVCKAEISRAKRASVKNDNERSETNSRMSKVTAAFQRSADKARGHFDRFFDTVIPTILLLRASNKPEAPVRPSSTISSFSKSSSVSATEKFRSNAGPFFWTALLGSLGVYAIYFAFVNPGLTLPLSASYQLFYDEHPFEVWDMQYAPKFTTASVMGVKYRVQWWFGLDGEDDSNAWDPSDAGEVHTYPIDVYSKESQKALLNFTREIQAAPWYEEKESLFFDDLVTAVGRKCGIYNESDDTWDGPSNCCEIEEEDFPLEPKVFQKCLKGWCNRNGMGTYWQGVYWDEDGEVALIKLKVTTNVDFTSSNPETKVFWDKIHDFESEKFFSNPAFSLDLSGLSKGWSTAQLTLYDVQQSLANGVEQTLKLSLLIAALVLYLTTQSLAVTVVGMLSISCILGWTITVCIYEGWHLSILESIVFSVAVGLSVDFCVHYSWATLLHLRKNEDVKVRKRELLVVSLSEMGGSVTMGSGTTIVAGCVMLLCKTLFFLRFGVFLVICMSFSWFYSTFFLQACFAALPDRWLKFKVQELWEGRGGKENRNGAMVMMEEDEDGEEGDNFEMEMTGVEITENRVLVVDDVSLSSF